LLSHSVPLSRALESIGGSAPNAAVIHYGLGAIGVEVARLVRDRAGLRSVAAIDINAELIGRSLDEVLGRPGRDAVVQVSSPTGGLRSDPGAVVLHCTTSRLVEAVPQVLGCIRAGFHVISTCEELSYPWEDHLELAREVDDAAKGRGVTVLGTGVNPGFAMDYLPIALSACAQRVAHVRVTRVQDASTRRQSLQRKVGAGLSDAEFKTRVKSGAIGHVGLRESARSLAAAFGWKITRLRTSLRPVHAGASTLRAGSQSQVVRGLRQEIRASVGEHEVIRLTLEISREAQRPRDEVILSGTPNIQMTIPGGLHGDVSTAALVVNTIPRVLQARAGLLAMFDLPPPRPW